MPGLTGSKRRSCNISDGLGCLLAEIFNIESEELSQEMVFHSVAFSPCQKSLSAHTNSDGDSVCLVANTPWSIGLRKIRRLEYIYDICHEQKFLLCIISQSRDQVTQQHSFYW